MILIKLILSLFFLLFQTSYEYEGTIREQCSFFQTDVMGNIYIIKDDRLIKYNNKLEKVADYSNAYLGEIGSLDTTDPLRLLIHYKEFNQLLWLDNYLLEIRSPVLLDEMGVDQAEVICTSSQGGFWLFNGLNDRIQYYDVNLELVHESIPVSHMIKNHKPVAMIEKNRMVYLLIPQTGILVFDRYASYSKLLPIYPDKAFQVTDKNIFYISNKIFYKYDLVSYTETSFELPEINGLLNINIQPKMLYLHNSKGIHIYHIKTD